MGKTTSLTKTHSKLKENLNPIKLLQWHHQNDFKIFQDILSKLDKNKKVYDLMDSVCSHYLVTDGNIYFHSKNSKNTSSINMEKDDSIWVSAYCEHGFSGKGSLIKISGWTKYKLS